MFLEKMVEENFIRLFEDSFRANWDLPGFSDYGEEKTLTYANIAKKIAKLHVLFEQCDIKKNDKIALIGRNSSNWAITYIATVTYGAIIVPILQDFNSNDIQHIVNHSDSKLFFADDLIWEHLEEEKMTHVKAVFSLNSFHCVSLLNQTRKKTEQDRNDATINEFSIIDSLDKHRLQPNSIKGLFYAKFPNGFFRDCVRYADKSNEEVVSINYTSGTTGFSKGVSTSGNALAGNITFGFRTKLIAPGYRIVSFLPLAHAYGCAFDFLASTCAGCHIHFVKKIASPKVLLKAFAEVRPSVVFTVPLIIEKIYKKQILPLLEKPTMRWVLSIPLLDQTILNQIRQKMIDAFGGEFSEIIIGGAPLNAEVEAFFHKIKFPFTVGYGMTECAPLISYSNKNDFIPTSCGKILDIMEVKINNPNPETGLGEIIIRGENLMTNYYKNEEATNDVLKDGWLHTGDLGTVDEEGNIFIRGRKKTMILSASGQNIYPEEIEAKLNNMPYVMESLIIENNRKLIALVYPDYDFIDSQNYSHSMLEKQMEENRKALNEMLGAYEKITKIRLYPHEFEKTPKKSIKRYLYSSNNTEEK